MAAAPTPTIRRDPAVDAFLDFITSVDGFLGYVLVAVLIPVGLYLTVRTGVVQLRLLPEMFRLVREPAGHDADGNKQISPFRAFCISAASRVGTANITGVALAISMGGLAWAMKTLPTGTSYAIWVGIGASIAVAWAMFTGSEPASPLKIALILGLIGCIIGLKLVS